ncbi:MAG: KipI antagonist [Firmicutes bacterium]|nr:KipI antagonist [Bacillota bacterium]
MIKVIRPGMLTTVQDSGRLGYQAYGMPVAGVMDSYAYRIANLLVANSCNAAVLEMTMLGGTFYFEQDTWVSICGADMQATLNGGKIQNWSRFFVPSGSELAFGYGTEGCRSYLAVYGGIAVPEMLGSRSTYTRGGIGGFKGRGLQVGDELPIGEGDNPPQYSIILPSEVVPQYTDTVQLRVILGPQDDLFTPQGIDILFNGAYQISSEADRMGYRLEGPKIEHIGKPEIISDALCQGAIQVPGHGMPIIMMADRGTTGGYAKIGTVIGPDLAKLAQAKPGDVVRFVQCSDNEAVAALQGVADRYGEIAAYIAEGKQTTLDKMRHYKVKIDGQIYDVKIVEG